MGGPQLRGMRTIKNHIPKEFWSNMFLEDFVCFRYLLQSGNDIKRKTLISTCWFETDQCARYTKFFGFCELCII